MKQRFLAALRSLEGWQKTTLTAGRRTRDYAAHLVAGVRRAVRERCSSRPNTWGRARAFAPSAHEYGTGDHGASDSRLTTPTL